MKDEWGHQRRTNPCAAFFLNHDHSILRLYHHLSSKYTLNKMLCYIYVCSIIYKKNCLQLQIQLYNFISALTLSCTLSRYQKELNQLQVFYGSTERWWIRTENKPLNSSAPQINEGNEAYHYFIYASLIFLFNVSPNWRAFNFY